VYENRVLRRIFDLSVRKWREAGVEERHNLYASRNVMRVIKSKKLRLAGHVARVREMKNA
jgi:hypothetical protein